MRKAIDDDPHESLFIFPTFFFQRRPSASGCMQHPWIQDSDTNASGDKLHRSHRAFMLIRKLPIFDRVGVCLVCLCKLLRAGGLVLLCLSAKETYFRRKRDLF